MAVSKTIASTVRTRLPVQFTQVDYMPHATMPEMSFRIWEEFFSKFSRD